MGNVNNRTSTLERIRALRARLAMIDTDRAAVDATLAEAEALLRRNPSARVDHLLARLALPLRPTLGARFPQIIATRLGRFSR
jgi:hypothetical protein